MVVVWKLDRVSLDRLPVCVGEGRRGQFAVATEVVHQRESDLEQVPTALCVPGRLPARQAQPDEAHDDEEGADDAQEVEGPPPSAADGWPG